MTTVTSTTRPPLGVSQAALELGVSRRTVLRLIRAGHLEAVKLGPNTAAYAIDAASIDGYLEGQA